MSRDRPLENGGAAGVEPAAPVEQSALQQEIGTAQMKQTTTTAPATRTTAAEMKDRVTAASLDRLIAALPDAVDESMRTAIPHLYTPELAAEFTAAMIAELRASRAQRQAVTS